MTPRYASYQSFIADYKQGLVNCEAMVSYYLKRIEETEALNVYLEVFEKEAILRAKDLDEKAECDRGRLFGMVVSIKDVLCYKDHIVTGGSKILEGFRSLFSATAVEHLLAEDAIIIGRVNCDEFAMGSTTENSSYGASRNALDTNKVPGGSSGGSAVAVQADTCLASIGSDTGGSVRQPASFCGLVGLKPTYGRISRHGLLAYGSSFDQIGPITHSVEDAALLLEVMSGKDDFDATMSDLPSFEFRNKKWKGRAKIAYFPATLSSDQVDPEVKVAADNFLKQMEKEGHELVPMDFDLLEYLVPTYYVMTTAEASTNLSRYDGVRYGHRAEEAKTLIESYKKSRTEGFGAEVKRRILLGTFVLSSGFYDAYYSKAQKVRRLLAEETKAIFRQCDFIFMPTSPIVAWDLGAKVDNPVAMYLADIYTVQANMVGSPAISIPAAIHSNGMPIGMQLMADRYDEERLLAFAMSMEIKK